MKNATTIAKRGDAVQITPNFTFPWGQRMLSGKISRVRKDGLEFVDGNNRKIFILTSQIQNIEKL